MTESIYVQADNTNRAVRADAEKVRSFDFRVVHPQQVSSLLKKQEKQLFGLDGEKRMTSCERALIIYRCFSFSGKPMLLFSVFFYFWMLKLVKNILHLLF